MQLHAYSVEIQDTSSKHLKYVNYGFIVCQVDVFNMLKQSSRCYVLQVFWLFAVRVYVMCCRCLGYLLLVFLLCVVGIFVMCCRCLGYLLQVFMLYVVGVYIICCRCFGYMVQKFMLCALGIYMSSSVCKNTYYNQFKMPTLTIQNAYFSMQKYLLKLV